MWKSSLMRLRRRDVARFLGRTHLAPALPQEDRDGGVRHAGVLVGDFGALLVGEEDEGVHGALWRAVGAERGAMRNPYHHLRRRARGRGHEVSRMLRGRRRWGALDLRLDLAAYGASHGPWWRAIKGDSGARPCGRVRQVSGWVH